jgi:peroxin-7
MPAPPIVTKTPGFNGYSVEFSPFFPHRYAVGAASNFGIVGNGRLFVFGMPSNLEKFYDTQDGVFDIAWNERHENQILSSCGDGSIKLWDLTLNDFPIRNWHEHTKEVYSVHWNLVNKQHFISGSWDLSIKLWDPEIPRSISTFAEHQNCIYQTIWSPHAGEIFASASGDHTVKLWDIRQPRSVQTIIAHQNEVLALDWNKYQRDQIVTSGVDKSIKSWDLRSPYLPIVELQGHGYAVRRLKCSPHDGNLVGSVSYDMTMRLWDLSLGQQVFVHDMHTEFVLGLDFNLFQRGSVATCGWDESVHLLQL